MSPQVPLSLLAACVALLPAAAGAQTAQPNPAGETVSYRFKDGDTLIAFAARYLIGDQAIDRVRTLNRIADQNRIRVGTVISIPKSILKSTPIDARFLAFSGDASIGTGSVLGAPQIGMQVREGNSLRTGNPGFLTIRLENGSRVTLPSRSHVRVARLRRYLLGGGSDIEFSVDQGKAETNAAKMRNTNDSFRFRTPVALSAVRGTVFRIGYDGPDRPSLTEVVEGAVAVAAGPANRSTMIPLGFGAAVARSGNIQTEELLPAPKLAPAVQREPVVRLDLGAVATARGYHVQISRDAGFIDILSEVETTTTEALLGDLPDGNYFVRATAIAQSGLEGMSDTHTLRRQRVALAAEAVDGGFKFAWAGRAKADFPYRFQLFKQNAAVPLVDEPGLDTASITVTGLQPGAYTWRVSSKAIEEGLLRESWTDLQRFSIGN